jgi:FolB domain-containing protein
MEKSPAQPGPESTPVNQPGDDDWDTSDHLSFLTPTSLTETTIPPIPVDTIHLRNLYVSAGIGHDAWDRPDKAQPIILSLQLQADTTAAGNSDDITDTFSYGQMCKDVLAKVGGKQFGSIDHLAWDLSELLSNWPGTILEMQVLAPKALLRVEGGLAKECTWRRGTTACLLHHGWAIRGLQIACIIGVNPHERLMKQSVTIHLRIAGATEGAAYKRQIVEGNVTWQRLVNRICDVSPLPLNLLPVY